MPKGEETFAEMCERLKKGKEPETRRLNAIPERHYFLIVSEGTPKRSRSIFSISKTGFRAIL